MPRFEKWLTNVAPAAPADQVARSALATRLRAVRHYLNLVTAGGHEAEAVHQLRIWTRRAAAALWFFEPGISRSRLQWMRRTLRKLRRAAGAVRDCDVHLERLESGNRQAPRRVRAELRRQRRHARQKLKRLHRRLCDNDRLTRRAEDLVGSIVWPKRHSSRAAPPFADWCREQLAPLADRFFELAEANLQDIEAIHALRIAGKRLRYALELTPAVMPPRAHQTLTSSLSEIQDRLGEICDHRTAIVQLRQCRADASKIRTREKLKELIHAEREALGQLQAGLLRWWTPARRRRLAALCRRACGKRT